MTYAESSDSEGGSGAEKAWSNSSERSEEGHSPRISKNPSSSGSFRKTASRRIERTSSLDNLEGLRSVPSVLDRKSLSGKVGDFTHQNVIFFLQCRIILS